MTRVKDVLVIADLAQTAITLLLNRARKEAFPGVNGWPHYVREQFTPVSIELAPGLGMASLDFVCFGEERSIKVFFECDCDNQDLGPASISLSMGMWGHSELYAKAILDAWSLLGTVYIDVNDCDDTGPTPLETEEMTLLRSIARGYVTPYKAQSIAAKFVAGQLPVERDFTAFVGLPPHEWHALTDDEDFNKCWDQMVARAKARYPADESRDRLLADEAAP